MKKQIRVAVLWMIMLFNLAGILLAEQGPEKAKSTFKGVTGEISAVSKDFIAIVYQRNEKTGTEEEIAFPVPKDVKLDHIQNLGQLGVGDFVDVAFEERTEEGKEGPTTKRIATVIRFVRKAAKPQESSALTSGEEEVPETEQQQQ